MVIADALKDVRPTEALYFEDTYCFEGDAVIEAVHVVGQSDGEGTEVDLVLSRTIFHPQGGGQPADAGTISSAESTVTITAVSKSGLGHIVHRGRLVRGPKFEVGTPVRLEIDGTRRRLHARLHSAGHLVDNAADRCGFIWKPTKGYHFPDSPYVEYEATIPPDQREPTRAALQSAIDAIVAERGPEPVDVTWVPYDQVEARCGEPPAPFFPTGEPIRVVAVAGSAARSYPCGGTHVKTLTDLGRILIDKVVVKSKRTRVYYSLTDSAAPPVQT